MCVWTSHLGKTQMNSTYRINRLFHEAKYQKPHGRNGLRRVFSHSWLLALLRPIGLVPGKSRGTMVSWCRETTVRNIFWFRLNSCFLWTVLTPFTTLVYAHMVWFSPLILPSFWYSLAQPWNRNKDLNKGSVGSCVVDFKDKAGRLIYMHALDSP